MKLIQCVHCHRLNKDGALHLSCKLVYYWWEMLLQECQAAAFFMLEHIWYLDKTVHLKILLLVVCAK
jgi:hypothetical protein